MQMLSWWLFFLALAPFEMDGGQLSPLAYLCYRVCVTGVVTMTELLSGNASTVKHPGIVKQMDSGIRGTLQQQVAEEMASWREGGHKLDGTRFCLSAALVLCNPQGSNICNVDHLGLLPYYPTFILSTSKKTFDQ